MPVRNLIYYKLQIINLKMIHLQIFTFLTGYIFCLLIKMQFIFYIVNLFELK